MWGKNSKADHILENKLLEAFPEMKFSFSSMYAGYVCGGEGGMNLLTLQAMNTHTHTHTHTHTRLRVEGEEGRNSYSGRGGSIRRNSRFRFILNSHSHYAGLK